MVGLCRQYAAIAGLGVLQSSRLLVGHTRRQEPGNLGLEVLVPRCSRWIVPFTHRGFGHRE
jgi:hypothetical protein